MSEKLRTIRLYGSLGTKFGRSHRLAVSSTAEAIRALCVLLPGFEKELTNSESKGVAYACFIGRRNIGEDALEFPVGEEPIRIAPVITGAKRAGLLQTIVGVVLVVVGAVLTYTGVGAAAGAPLMKIGAVLALGGVVQMLSPQQRGLSAKDGPDNGASYNFNGPVNTTAQGNPVPYFAGEGIVGSVVISGGIYAEDQV
ncbi:tail assembly protein [Bordetella flabilis]|uniref:Phage tail protein n=1 Tax=Bordetella flabilis TaxID=463014 RepID=A0A193GH38_9BORD|nr:tail assembly protein [Bordetella flabilis]ANN78903.1 phage tail protein [Bordetella flabilis]